MNYFFIGIGGAGMSAIAGYLLERGEGVFGCDITENAAIKRLKALGAIITDDPEQILCCDVVVYSPAIDESNVFLRKARLSGAKIMRRDVLLGSIFNGYESSVAVAGMHGKTTVSALIAHIFKYCGLSPTALLGGEIKPDRTNYYCGKGNICIAEACEYKQSLLHLSPTVAVILNADLDHTDCYESIDEIYKTFNAFINGFSPNATVLAHESCKSFIATDKRVIYFGNEANCTFRASNFVSDKGKYYFDIFINGNYTCNITHNLHGKHNISNLLAAFACAYLYGIDKNAIKEAIARFSGIVRRYDVSFINGREVITDYAHHPKQIKALIETAIDSGKKPITALFQPHTYSRTKSLMKEFSECFDGVDRLIILPVYAAREKPIYGGTSEALAESLLTRGSPFEIHSALGFKEAAEIIRKSNDTLLVIGAGDVTEIKKHL